MKPGARNLLHRLLRPVEAPVDHALHLLAARRRAGGPGAGQQPGDTPRRVLLSRPDLIGDVVLFTTALRLYREWLPDAEIVLLVRETVAPLIERCPFISSIWSLPAARYRLDPRERYSWWRRLSHHGFDLAIHAPYSTSWEHYAPLVGWTGARRRVAFEHRGPGRTRISPGPWFTELVPSSGPWTHVLARDAEPVRHLSGPGSGRYRPTLWLSDEDRTRAAALRPQGRVGVVSPGAGSDLRRWSPGSFAEVIRHIHAEHRLTWLVCGVREERELCGSLTGLLRESGIPSLNMAGRFSLASFAAMLESADLFLGNDSGPAHIANAVGTPSVYIVGGGFPGVHVPHAETRRAAALTHHIECEGCLWQCVQSEPFCITRVRVTDVVEAARTVLKEPRDA